MSSKTFQLKAVMALTLVSVSSWLLLTGCNKSSDSSGTATASTVTVAGTMSNIATAASFNEDSAVETFAAADYKLYCVTFASSPTAATSAFAADGKFSLSLPANTPFGCFINSVSTNLPVATIMIQGSGSGFSSKSTTSMSLASNVDLGSLTLDLTNNRVVVPASAIAASSSASTAGISLADVDNYEFTMSCVTTGNTQMDAACSTFIAQGNKVYFRILSGTQSGAVAYGISVWGSAADFNACGGIELNTLSKASIETGGFTFSTSGDYAPVTAAAFSNFGGTCARRGETAFTAYTASTANAHADIRQNYCTAPMNSNGSGYSFVCSDSATVSGCSYSSSTSVTFTPGSSGAEMYGAFVTNEYRNAGCGGGAKDQNAAFNVKFTRGSKL